MNFDLNIENYKTNELLDIFGLPQTYDQKVLELYEKRLTDTINNNKIISPEIKNKTIHFVIQAKQILLGNIQSQSGLGSGSGSQNANAHLQTQIDKIYNLNYNMNPVKLENPQEHMIQVRPTSAHIESKPKDFFPGIFNPLKRSTSRVYLNIDTRFRENYYGSSSTNYNLSLPTQFYNVLSMMLFSIEIPTSYYVISKQFGNNYFTLIVEGENPAVITIPNGNHSATGIITYLNDEMLKMGGNFQYVSFNINIDETGDGSNQMIVNIDASKNLSFSLNFQANMYGEEDRNTPLPLKLGWKFGFRNGIYENNITYVGEGLIDLSGPRYLYLAIDDYHNNVGNDFYGVFNSSILNKNILTRINTLNTTLNYQPFNLFSENNFKSINYPRTYYGPVTIQNLGIQLLDEYGRVVDLNNMDFSFCLTLEIAYDL